MKNEEMKRTEIVTVNFCNGRDKVCPAEHALMTLTLID